MFISRKKSPPQAMKCRELKKLELPSPFGVPPKRTDCLRFIIPHYILPSPPSGERLFTWRGTFMESQIRGELAGSGSGGNQKGKVGRSS